MTRHGAAAPDGGADDDPTWTPVAVTMVELDDPGPPPAGAYGSVWVVGGRSGVPVGIAEVDLRRTGDWARALGDLDRRSPATAAALVPDEVLPRASVVVPTIVQRVDDLRRCLTSLAGLDHPDVEVVLVDNRPHPVEPDPLPGLLAQFPAVRLVIERRPGISAARNAGVRAATGDIVVFTDDDVRVQPEWLRALVSRFVREPDVTAVTGLILPAELETPAQLHFERFYGGFSGVRTFAPLTLRPGRRRGLVQVVRADGTVEREFAVYGIGAFGAGANMAFRRSWLTAGHEFDLTLGVGTPSRGGEDLAALVDVLWSGGRLGYEPAAVVWHRHRRGAEELARQLKGNGTGFVAMLVALVVGDPRHLVAILGQLPTAGRRVLGQALERLRSPAARVVGQGSGGEPAVDPGRSFPRSLVLHELGGMPRGPWAYVRSRAGARRQDAADRAASSSTT